mmetsp:Transcript_27607/g.33756  ORF Transcript_27607/g.33756 Transcript_27607/m.33756 type:complete len:112 (-) Transcript_27607:140-475(-)|eukprot:CAMPEP_0204832358 /NCGR_PEP_ID=MMETSP1346-20131115/13378_1 /ASSEMBLY_ACC=CAM_ASM_000771 /TAXON_ID=215587 /ORGANISM="Aplanochytrium stocchinoi, Strain GSBS06" /LENGTH=111 /DNA_ID=CAMNT_0051964115 /DNA_START=98 /DNA_END=433 /DNA_ORIENTATION=+
MDGSPREHISDNDSESVSDAIHVDTDGGVEKQIEDKNASSDTSDKDLEDDSDAVVIRPSRENRKKLGKREQREQVSGPINRFIRVLNSRTSRQGSLTKEESGNKFFRRLKN